jgi:16S rRNA (uracil1498-N3)-methyltransferase
VTLPHFFIDEIALVDEQRRVALRVDKQLGDHLRSARIRPGERIVVIDLENRGLEIEVDFISTPGELEGRVMRILLDRIGEQLTLVQGISKTEHMDQTIRQATELGLVRIIPLLAERSTVRIQGDAQKSKLERWQRIAKAAAEQSGRFNLPTIESLCNLTDCLAELSDYDGLIVAWEEAPEGDIGVLVEKIKKRVFANPKVALFVGPEGGFSAAEVSQMMAAGAVCASLGANILRTETAALTASALVLYHLGGLGADKL